MYPLAPAKCPDGMVVVGYDGSDTSLVRRIRLSCAPLSWNGTDYALGSPQNTASLGRSDGNDRGPWTCAAGQVAAGMQGRSGTLLDHFQLRCYALAPTY